MSKHVLICSSPDLNYIDGSSIWAQTIALAFSGNKDIAVDFIAKSKPERYELYQPLIDQDNITIIDGTLPEYWNGKGFRRLSSIQMAEITAHLSREKNYDAVIIRGLEIAQKMLDYPKVLQKSWLYLTDIPQDIDEYSSDLKKVMKQLATESQFILCQTLGFIDLWKQLAPNIPLSKFKIYAPVIPDIDFNLIPIENRESKVIYAGKFKSDWKTLEMACQWEKCYTTFPNSELLMLGDKIHHEKDRPEYHDLMLDALKNTKGLSWLGAKSREEVQNLLKISKVGLSWRSESMNDTLEYSTKILEYGGAGCAAILNRNPLHESLLGVDYPLFANSEEEFSEKLLLALSDEHILKQAARKMFELASRHTFSNRVKELKQWLQEAIENLSLCQSKSKIILVAGHDLKFFQLLQNKLSETGKYHFIIDKWSGHNKHNEVQSRALLEQADIIFCEWCLGNLEWYSKNKKSNQKLIARFHAQESKLPYLGNSNLEAIDHISFVSEHIRHEALMKVPDLSLDKTSVIANYLDDQKFTPLKKMGDAQFVLGIIGVTPRGKRLDRAIDLLESLLEKDNRYYLRVKGNHPLSYSWMHNRPEEIEYYKNIFRRINENPQLRYKVIFDPPGDDVNQWLSLVGYILSPSDAESFHMAIGEGMLTGCYPIIWNWNGAEQLWGKNLVVSSIKQAQKSILGGRFLSSTISIPSKMLSEKVINEWIILMSGL